MYKVALINMPFANPWIPSIALTQLKSVLDQRLGPEVTVDIFYLNHNFAKYFGLELYHQLSNSADSQNSGLGDWVFRQLAFPDLPNNAGVYLTRYFSNRSEKNDKLKGRVLETRRGLDQFMERLITEYKLDQYDLAGFTSMFMQNVPSFAMAKKLKARNADLITVMGGANCESPMGQVIVKNLPEIDYVFSGPGLKSFPDFVQHCIEGERWKCGNIKGVFSKKQYILQSGPEAIGEELSIDVPIELDYQPFVQTLEEHFPKGEVTPILLFETSRGCWWGERAHCTFCGLNGASMAYRAMNPELALKQFEALFKFSPQVTRLEAVDNILPKSYLQDVLPLLNTPPEVSMFYEVKADLSDEEMEVLAKARVKAIQPGIESLATSTLKLMKKGTSVFTNLMLLKNCARLDIEPSWNLLIGFPGEGADVYRKYVSDIPLLTHLPSPSDVYPVRFDRYSPYFVKAQEYQLDLHPLDFYRLIYPFTEEDLGQLAYYFADMNTDAEYSTVMVEWIDKIREKVSPWVASWRRERSARPKLFLKEDGGVTTIYDSRAGTAIEYEIGENSKDILAYLNSPRRVSNISKEFGDRPGFDAVKEVEYLQQKGLIFQEHDRFLSLVLDAEGKES